MKSREWDSQANSGLQIGFSAVVSSVGTRSWHGCIKNDLHSTNMSTAVLSPKALYDQDMQLLEGQMGLIQEVGSVRTDFCLLS